MTNKYVLNDPNSMAQYMRDKEKEIKDLEKENAELKGLKDVATLIRANNDTGITLMQLNNMLVSKSQQLAQAKSYIKYFVGILKNLGADKEELVIEAEQFLKE